MNHVNRIYPPPGENLVLPDWTVQHFFRKIGGDCEEFHENFSDLKEIMAITPYQMRKYKKKVPCQQRRYILRCRNQLKKGILTFEYLNRRTCLDKVRD